MIATAVATKQVVDTMQNYLGPAAERFVARMLETHLHKDNVEVLSPTEIQQLSEKVEAALKHLDQDSTLAQAASKELLGLIR